MRKQHNKQMRATESSVQLQLVAENLSENVWGHHALLYRLMLKLSKPVTRQMLTVSLPPGSTASATSSMSSARQAKLTPCCTHAACVVHNVIQKSSVCQRDQDTVLAHVTHHTANTGDGDMSDIHVSQVCLHLAAGFCQMSYITHLRTRCTRCGAYKASPVCDHACGLLYVSADLFPTYES